MSAPSTAWIQTRQLVTWAVLLVVALGVIHGRLVVTDPVLTRDDRTLLTPIESIHSLSDYVAARQAWQVMDLQPVRDASLFGDVFVERHTGWRVHHLTNLLWWMVIVALGAALLLQDFGWRRRTVIAISLLAVHPVAVGAVAWISARKHLLSCAFILAATLFVIRSLNHDRPRWRGLAATPLLFLASVLSQPITVLWPLWMAAVLAVRRIPLRHRAWFVLGASLPLMVAVQWANYRYYTGDYSRATNVPKLVELSLKAPLLAHGRYAWNMLVPTSLSTQYDPEQWRNLAGLALCAVGVTAALRWLSLRSLVMWGGLYLFPLAIVTLRMTNIFVSDTYMLTSMVGLAGLLIEASLRVSESVAAPQRLRLQVVALTAFLLCVGLSTAQASTWRTDAALWARAYETDATPTSIARHAFYLMEQKQWDEALECASTLRQRAPQHPEMPFTYAKAVSQHPALPLPAKIERLENATTDDPWALYFLAGLHASSNRFDRSWELMQTALRQAERFKNELGTIGAESQFFCVRAKGDDCEQRIDALRTTTPHGTKRSTNDDCAPSA